MQNKEISYMLGTDCTEQDDRLLLHLCAYGGYRENKSIRGVGADWQDDLLLLWEQHKMTYD